METAIAKQRGKEVVVKIIPQKLYEKNKAHYEEDGWVEATEEQVKNAGIEIEPAKKNVNKPKAKKDE